MVRPETMISSDKVLERVSNRMERATKTKLISPVGAEMFQVANYGLGGQYSQHTDPHGYWDGLTKDPGYAQTGDRLITIMVFLPSADIMMMMIMMMMMMMMMMSSGV